jgi:hypothetical protein
MLGPCRTVLTVVALAASMLVPRAARAEAGAEDPDSLANRRWRLVVGVPSIRLNAWPMGWQINGEIGVEFHRFNVIVAQATVHPVFGGGGGVGYLYKHEFVRHTVSLQAGAFLGYWYVTDRDWDWESAGNEVLAFFCPTVRVTAGWRYVFLQLGFTAQLGTSVVPSFDIGLHFRV